MFEWLMVIVLWSGTREHVIMMFNTEAECRTALKDYKKEIKLGPTSTIDYYHNDYD